MSFCNWYLTNVAVVEQFNWKPGHHNNSLLRCNNIKQRRHLNNTNDYYDWNRNFVATSDADKRPLANKMRQDRTTRIGWPTLHKQQPPMQDLTELCQSTAYKFLSPLHILVTYYIQDPHTSSSHNITSGFVYSGFFIPPLLRWSIDCLLAWMTEFLLLLLLSRPDGKQGGLKFNIFYQTL